MVRTATLVAASFAALALGCSETVERPPPPPVDWASLEARPMAADAGAAPATAKEREVSSAYLRALASSDLSEVAKLLDDDAHFTFAGFRDIRGRDNVVSVHRALLGSIDNRKFTETRRFLADSSQIVEWTMSGIDRATRKPLATRGVSLLWTKDDGTLTDVHLYFDQAVLDAQLGKGPKGLVSPPPPPAPPEHAVEVEEQRTAEERANVNVVRGSLDAVEGNEETKYLGALTEDIEVTTLESAKPQKGRASAGAYFRSTRRSIAQLDTTVDNAWGMRSFVVVEYDLVGEQRGPIGFVPAQPDNLLKMFVVDIVEMRDAKIARVWRYDNPSQILLLP